MGHRIILADLGQTTSEATALEWHQRSAISSRGEPKLASAPAASAATLTDSRRIEMLRLMLLCRHVEDRVYYLFLQGRMPGTIHQSQGREASAAGVCSALEPGDMITSTHRPHHLSRPFRACHGELQCPFG